MNPGGGLGRQIIEPKLDLRLAEFNALFVSDGSLFYFRS
jgi:hypothetical protein